MQRSTVLRASSRVATAVGAVVITAVVVSGGLAVAQAGTEAVANNSVNSAKIFDNSILSADIRNNTVASVDIANSTIAGVDIANDTVASADVLDGSVAAVDLAPEVLPATVRVTVDAEGDPVIVSGRGATSVLEQGSGNYTVAFDRAIGGCWASTAFHDAVGGSDGRMLTINQGFDAVLVSVSDLAGAPAPLTVTDGFSLVLTC
jgi:hypothetical protein